MIRPTHLVDTLNTQGEQENNDDLLALFDVLSSIRDCNEKKLCFTSNMVMTNPDFEKIKYENYNKYIYEPVQESLKKYKNRDNVKYLWHQGLSDKILYPQFHAREHIMYWLWLKDLKSGNKETLDTYGNGTPND